MKNLCSESETLTDKPVPTPAQAGQRRIGTLIGVIVCGLTFLFVLTKFDMINGNHNLE